MKERNMKIFIVIPFSCKHLGHPALFDLRDTSMSLIVQSEK